MQTKSEKKFYDALSDLFVGAKIEGDSGYVNLMSIKSRYYEGVLAELQKQINEDKIIDDNFREEFFDRLYDFFHKYFSESGSVYFVKTYPYYKVYERVYSSDKDVVLFWKTHMLYYVKSDILFKSIEVEVEDDYKNKHYFFFDVGELEQKQNNEKKELVFKFKEVRKEKAENGDEKIVVVLSVEYSERGSKTKIDEILKKLKKNNYKISEELLGKAIRVFKKQSEVDFFINKDAKAFLEEQLHLYLHKLLLEDKNKFDQKRLNQIKTIQKYAKKIINFIAQFEDELVAIWNKPKFALNANYVITIDKLPKDILEKLAKHKGLKEQIKEWQELGIVDEDFKFKDAFESGKIGEKLTDKYKHLPIDTKYFKDLEIEILDLFENLDEALDGRLIHSENYQALNTLLPKYKEKVDLIYIDPPYNAPASEIIYVNRFKHSSWLTLMENRVSIVKHFLKEDGIFESAIDDNEQERFGCLLDSIFPDYDKTCVTIKHNPRGVQGNNFSATHEYTYFLVPKNVKISDIKIDESEISWRGLRDNGGESLRINAKNCFYPILVDKRGLEIIGFGDVCDDDFHPGNVNIERGMLLKYIQLIHRVLKGSGDMQDKV